jgi:hypothetical protein
VDPLLDLDPQLEKKLDLDPQCGSETLKGPGTGFHSLFVFAEAAREIPQPEVAAATDEENHADSESEGSDKFSTCSPVIF